MIYGPVPCSDKTAIINEMQGFRDYYATLFELLQSYCCRPCLQGDYKFTDFISHYFCVGILTDVPMEQRILDANAGKQLS